DASLPFTQTGTTLTFDIGTLALNDTVPVTIHVRPAINGTITNRAFVSATVLDPFPGNDSASVDTQVNLPAGTSVLAFMVDRFNVGEGDGAAVVTVTRTNSLSGTVSVDFATSDGTAVNGQDYQGTSGTLTFADSEATKTFFVPIFEDP